MNTPADSPGGEVLVYEAADGSARVDVRLEQDTVWLTQRQMSELFATSTDNVGLHLKNIFSESELEESATTEDFSVVQSEGGRQVRRQIKYYNLDAIISVGYRVKSAQGTRFRQWATRVLRNHLVQGYTFNQTRLAERGLRETRQTLDLVARTLQNPNYEKDKRSPRLLFSPRFWARPGFFFLRFRVWRETGVYLTSMPILGSAPLPPADRAYVGARPKP